MSRERIQRERGGYLRLQRACACSNLADGISLVALPLLALALQASPREIGLVAMARTAPWLLASLPAGALIDHFGAGRAFRLASAGRVALFLGALLLSSLSPGAAILVLAAVAFAAGVLEVIADNSLQTLVPYTVPVEELRPANGRFHLIETVANQFVGAPLGGVLAALDATAPLLAIAALYGASLLLVARLELGAPSTSERARGAISAGMRHVLSSPVLRALASVTGLANLAVAGVAAIFVLYVTSHLHAPPWAFGLLFSAQAVGVAAAAVLAPRLVARVGEAAALRLVLLGLPLPVAVLAATASMTATLGAQLLLGVLEGVWGVVAVAYRQEVVPARLLGRANAFYRLVASGTLPVGSWMAGVLAEREGIPLTYGWFAVVLCAIWGFLPIISQPRLDIERGLLHAK